jgi:hypothetical protein
MPTGINSSIETILIDGLTYYLPKNTDEIKDLMIYAKDSNLKIAMRGAAHSFPLIPTQEQQSDNLFISLGYLNNVTLDKDTGLVTAGAGCHLGYDPFDPLKLSTIVNSLNYQLDPVGENGRRPGSGGWALPDLGGISHQTVGGFTATGSSGGSVLYSFDSAIMSITCMHYIDNDVVTQTYTRPVPDNPEDPFYAIAFAHMGLMGIVTEMVFQCVPAFDIKGTETISQPDKCSIDLFGTGDATRPSLATFFEGETANYSRLIWWPQPGEERIVVWEASRQAPASEPANFPQPYKEVPYYFSSPLLSTLGADVLMTVLGRWQSWLGDFVGTNTEKYAMMLKMGNMLMPMMTKFVLDQFVSLDTPVQNFYDVWWKGLTMDNQMGDRLFPVWFTELWIPYSEAEQVAAVMQNLKDFYKDPAHPERAGTFCCEIYAAGSNNFWMSPAYKTDVIRIDIFWFAGNTDSTPQSYYQQFWDQLAPFNFRPHWGKYLPDPAGATGAAWLQKQYPKWNDFMMLRAKLDPYNLLLSDYWKQHLGL